MPTPRARRAWWPQGRRIVVALLTLGLMFVTPGVAAPPAEFQTSVVVDDGLNGPSGFDIAPDGRIFILERAGKVKIVKNGQLLPTPFADLPSEDTGDRGLIGIAFDPDFGSVQPLRLLLLHGPRPAEPPGPVQRGMRTSAPMDHSSCSGRPRRHSCCTWAGASASGPTASSTSQWVTTATARTPRT